MTRIIGLGSFDPNFDLASGTPPWTPGYTEISHFRAPYKNAYLSGFGVEAEPGLWDKTKAWWASQSSGTQLALGLAGVALTGLLIHSWTSGNRYNSNKRRTRSRRRAGGRRYRRNSSSRRKEERCNCESLHCDHGEAACRRHAGDKRAMYVGAVCDQCAAVLGPRYLKNARGLAARRAPPKKYRSKGAKRASDYAWPTGYRYPLIFRDARGRIKPEVTRRHIVAAKGFFTKFKRRYPATVRREIARRINAASRRFGVGGKVVRP